MTEMNTGFSDFPEESSEEPYSRALTEYSVLSTSSAAHVCQPLPTLSTTLSLSQCNLTVPIGASNSFALPKSSSISSKNNFEIFIRFDGIRPQAATKDIPGRTLKLADNLKVPLTTHRSSPELACYPLQRFQDLSSICQNLRPTNVANLIELPQLRPVFAY